MTKHRLQLFLALQTLLASLIACHGDPEQAKQRYLKSGQHYFDNAQYEEASIQFRKALQYDPRFGEGYFRLGLSYIKLQRWQEAYSALTGAVELAPQNTQAHLRLGELE